jgi:NAD(P)-dependent dehydrogenase (short-subunit alcohol dehydrogenase family)
MHRVAGPHIRDVARLILAGANSHSLKGKVAVITGGNQGIGATIAAAFAERGAAVAIAARNTATLHETAAVIQELGAECLPVQCDVADEASVEAMGDAVYRRFSDVDIVVANAGIGGPTALLQDITFEQWRECLATDLDGVFLTFRRFIPRMIERGSGCLIAISSMTGKRPLRGRTPYAASKMGVIGLVRTLALELGAHGIRVNAVCPGAVEGPRIEMVIERQAKLQGVSNEVARAQLIDAAPLKRAVPPRDVAAACVFLASPEADSITGEDLNVTAGLVMY